MKLRTLSAGILPGLLLLALSPASLAQEGVVWNSINGGTLGTSVVTTTGFAATSSITQSNFSTGNFSFAPLSATQDSVNYGANENWTADFAPAISGGVLWYGNFIRGAGGFSPGGVEVEYTFNHTPVIVSGFSQCHVIGDTFFAPESGFHWGILMFSGTIDTLSCTTNAAGISFQGCTIGTLPPAPALGVNYCMANPNSTGVAGLISAAGSDVAADNNVELTASDLPNNAFGFFVVSSSQGFVMNPGGSSGNLCLSGAVGRYVGPGQIQNTGTAGSFSLVADLTAIPSPTGPVTTTVGDTWNFQCWFRDTSPTGATSNFTDGLEILFQ